MPRRGHPLRSRRARPRQARARTTGPAGRDRLPRPWLPAGCALLANEGAGEVQTPVRLPAGTVLAIGEPLLFRHAKAGELCERFETLLLLRGDRVVERVPTYRGEGRSFF